MIDSRQAESEKTPGEVGRYQLVGAEIGPTLVNKVLSPPQKRIFRIDTVTGKTEEFTERVDDGTYRCKFLGIPREPKQADLEMPYKRMKLIPKPGPEVTVIASTARPPIDGEGEGKYNFVCGHCEEMLAKKVWSKQALQNLVILCPNCGQYNATEL